MAALVGHIELEILKNLLARLDLVREVFALPHVAAAALVDRELGVDEVAVVLHEPVDAVEVAALFVGRERQNQIPIVREPFLF